MALGLETWALAPALPLPCSVISGKPLVCSRMHGASRMGWGRQLSLGRLPAGGEWSREISSPEAAPLPAPAKAILPRLNLSSPEAAAQREERDREGRQAPV